MPAILILYEADHLNKATALMNALNNTARIDPVDTNPIKIAGLTTLIFWGHGSATGLCRKSGDEIIRIIKEWKAVNKDLETVEIITCNSRHFDDNWLGKTGKDGKALRDSKGKQIDDAPAVYLKSRIAHAISGAKINNSMAKQVKRGLKYSVWPSIRKIKLKSMPESVNGSFNQYSILYFDPATSTWCYVTGPSEREMFIMGNNIKQKKKAPPEEGVVWGGPRPGSFPVKLAGARVDFPNADFTDVQAGLIGDLRNVLVDIH